MGLSDFAFSLQMRDTIQRLMRESIDTLRPRYRYAKVNTIDRTTRKCTVTFNGETDPVIVNMGSIQPLEPDQYVRVEGIGTDKFITEVMGQAIVDTPPLVVSGAVTMFAGATPKLPSGWLFCDGAAVSRTTYAELFSAIGTTYGVGDSSTTFNLPNFRGRVPVGYDATQTEFDILGESGGTKAHTHFHASPVGLSSGTAFVISPNDASQDDFGANTSFDHVATSATVADVANQRSAPIEVHKVTSSPSSSLQPYLTMNYIIKY